MDTTFTKQERREIAGRARTVHERVEGPPNEPGAEPPIEPEQILHEWKDKFPDEAAFYERLRRDGLTEETVREQLAATRWPADHPLPDWIHTVEEMVRHVEATPTADRHAIGVTVPEETPFVELLASIAEYARQRLPTGTVTIDAMSPMVEGFVSQLSKTCVRPLYVEFKSFVEYHDPELAKADPGDVANPDTTYYDQFIDAMFEHGFKNLFVEYPVLGRQVVVFVENWIDAITEVCERLERDEMTLRERFGVEGNITALSPLADDVHGGGRIPVRVSFETGDVIYKPRPVDGGVAFYTILERLDEYLSLPSFETPTYVPREEYGWMEYVEYRDVPNETAATRYYERAGAMLCVAYALNFTDCQLENLIVDGENPMIVDGETLFHPHMDADAKQVPEEIFDVMDGSVLLTALLPWSAGDPREPDKQGLAASVAGFGRKSGQTQLANRSLPSVEAVNTDVMSVKEEEMTVGLSTNTPSIGGEDQSPDDYIDALVRGFEETHETIRRLHVDGKFLSTIATYDLIDGIENRLVYRATMQYRSIRRSTTARNPLRDGARFTVEFEDLAVPFFDGRIKTDRHWELYEAERRDLRRQDIPRFTSRPDQRRLFHHGEPLDVVADESGYNHAKRRLDAMDEDDLAEQVWLLRQIYDTAEPDESTPEPTEITEDRLQRDAEELFDDVMDAAIDTPDGHGWISVCPTNTMVNLAPASYSLFWGRGGIALSAAALYDATGEQRYRRVVSETLDPLLEDLSSGDFSASLGGTKGVGSVVYTLSVIAELLDDDAYRAGALAATQKVTAEKLARDDVFDVMEGSAGTLLGLLAYYERYGESSVLDRAIECGERLLEARVTVNGCRVWNTGDRETPITGFSHGSSGIAYALARLAAATDDARYAEAAREALDFESSLYAPDRDNWASSSAVENYRDRWCHGRAGIALARIGISEQLNDSSLLPTVNDALSATATERPSHLDNVCCGNLGRVETILVGARRADGDLDAAETLLGRCLTRRDRGGVLSLPGHSEAFVNPTFFDGISGAIYTLLRLRDPDSLPSVLLLE
ncbi:Lanthionine synthetase C family protein [Haladaptatus paucihalophilus DX253]|uniref:Lanthionine synthetase C family protein n=1 Tax=Haladaptatus paucihalophilus DX253 TaxID=797209 RepID=E7QZ77_HALPU|nr:type 2 lanthipeptide synthetase LanM family protein [Haladaptatus paucihalophilus]EFW89998.1 Lanthionine synthetase C family protein [Haladaptatus paucihalophilus DX253]SHL02145.1 type 2 lantibiotic biosynthesis protein LanM [Haladaptatus paucihalophilus DX253]